jgi:cyclopropane fatty-acyl-phospholipid synthase-like methyltransferase
MRMNAFAILAVMLAASLPAASDTQQPRRTPDIHYTPTRHAVAEVMLQLAQVTAADVVYDLGAGDGRIPIIAAQKYGARGVGIEIDPRLVTIARTNAKEAGVSDRVTFVEGDLFEANLSGATVVTLYLSASVNARLENKLKAELKPGTRIVSHQFPIGNWPPDDRVRPEFVDLYLWRIR